MPSVKEKNYRPTDREPFMNERQREYFREKLMAWKDDILKEAKDVVAEGRDHRDRGLRRGDVDEAASGAAHVRFLPLWGESSVMRG